MVRWSLSSWQAVPCAPDAPSVQAKPETKLSQEDQSIWPIWVPKIKSSACLRLFHQEAVVVTNARLITQLMP
jgi:hypothetical protein